MGKGKLAAQTAHAAVTLAEEAKKHNAEWWIAWLEEGQSKIVVKVDSEESLRELEMKARSLHLPTAMIRDRGLTQVPPGTVTCLGIGPGPSQIVDKVTGNLPLL